MQGAGAVTRNSTLTAEQDASRFLAQATLGADLALIQEVASIGIEPWIDQQFALPQSQVLDYLYADLFDETTIGEDTPWRELFRYALWQTTLYGSDLLRQRVALALSEIFVISTETDAIYAVANGAADRYDMLLRNAFGNFRDLLQDVTLIFTGIQYDFEGDPHIIWTPDFNSGWLNPYTAVRPMKMWDEEHEPGSKTLLNGYVVSDGREYGVHPSMPEVAQLFDAGDLAFVANVGALVEPTTLAGIESGLAKLPPDYIRIAIRLLIGKPLPQISGRVLVGRPSHQYDGRFV